MKVFEAIQLGMPMCWLGGFFGVLRLGPKHTEAYLNDYLPWVLESAQRAKPLINVYFEKHLDKPIDQLFKIFSRFVFKFQIYHLWIKNK